MPGAKLQYDSNQNLPIHFAFRSRHGSDFLQKAAKGRSQGGYVVDDRKREGVGNQIAIVIPFFTQIRGAALQIRGAALQIRGAGNRNSGRWPEYIVRRRNGLAGEVVNSPPFYGGFIN